MGWGGIEIYTQPGSDKWRGGASFDFNDEALNARSPFAAARAPYQQRAFGFFLSGPVIPKRASFTTYFNRYANDSNSVVNATVLDPVTLAPVLFSRSLVTPQVATYAALRGDLKINKRTRSSPTTGTAKTPRTCRASRLLAPLARLPRAAQRPHPASHETAIINETTINESACRSAAATSGRWATRSSRP